MLTPASCLMMLLYSTRCNAKALLVHVALLYEAAGAINVIQLEMHMLPQLCAH